MNEQLRNLGERLWQSAAEKLSKNHSSDEVFASVGALAEQLTREMHAAEMLAEPSGEEWGNACAETRNSPFYSYSACKQAFANRRARYEKKLDPQREAMHKALLPWMLALPTSERERMVDAIIDAARKEQR